MELPIDMQHLEFFTDGDPEEEKELFDLFLEQSEETITQLRLGLENDDVWHKAAHKMKGSAANMGANRLAELCKSAEIAGEEDTVDKPKMLDNIVDEIDKIEHFIHSRAA